MTSKGENTSVPMKSEMVRWLLIVLAVVFVLEFGIMLLLVNLFVQAPRWVLGLFDSLLLIILLAPFFYSIFRYFGFRYPAQSLAVPINLRRQLFGIVILSIFVVEFGIMIIADFSVELLLPIFTGIPHLLFDTILDSFFLVIFLYPLIYWLIIRPLLEQMAERERVEGALRKEEITVAKIRSEAEKAEAIKTLSMTYAHNIFNTIAPVQGYAELILKKLEPSQPEYRQCQKIIDKSRQVTEIVDQLRKIESANVTQLGGVDIYQIKGKNEQ